MRRLILILSFFFQAEDGIRDLYVTGVQTCALPIWSSWLWRRWLQRFAQTAEAISATTKKTEKVRITAEYLKSRSEERRVGRECGWRLVVEHQLMCDVSPVWECS